MKSNSSDPKPLLTVEEIRKLFAEGRKLREELEKRLEPMSCPSFEHRFTKCR